MSSGSSECDSYRKSSVDICQVCRLSQKVYKILKRESKGNVPLSYSVCVYLCGLFEVNNGILLKEPLLSALRKLAKNQADGVPCGLEVV
jgi:hypothetical protein